MSPENDVVSSAPGGFRLRWDVFLSFRGPDTRDSITKHLYDALQSRGVRVFRDDDGLRRGDEIAPSLLEAIDDSAASIVILSPNYASSHWCLEELAKIWECRRLILPVFCNVDPSDVRKQKGPFEESFQNHESRFQKEKVNKWREAMNKVGGVAGWVFPNNRGEADLVRQLLQRILKELSKTPVGVAKFTVGLDDRVEELLKLLDLKSNGVKLLGLFGMGGIGKTTLAKTLYNKIVAHFECRSFISDVREASSTVEGLIFLQNKLISNLSKATDTVNDINDGIDTIRRIVKQKRVLVVLDDVSDVNQLDSLIGRKERLYNGSRVIITTRDKQVLPESYVESNELYEVKELKLSEALELFSYHSLRRKEPSENFLNMSNQIVSLTGGLPLALEVFGSFLFDKRREEEWRDALEKLRQIRPGNLQGILKISFDGLDEQEKCIFLDIACFFVGMEMNRDDVVDVLRGCGFKGEIAITVLCNKCLIKIKEDSAMWMHDQIRDMGRQIVINENLTDPGKRSRLWNRDEIISVLKDKKGTRCIQGIVLGFSKKSTMQVSDRRGDQITWDNFRQRPSCNSASAYMKERYKKYVKDRAEKARMLVLQTQNFQSMVALRLLQINYWRMEGKFRCLPRGLKWLQWKRCPLRKFSFDYVPSEIAVLDLSESQIETLRGRHSNKGCENLMVLNLSRSYSLRAVPDLTGYSSLEKIDLEGCTLSKIHESVGSLSSLVRLNMHRCTNLLELPSDVSGLTRLESLVLSDCNKLKALPKDISRMVSLRQLLIDDTAISELPESIFHLIKLEKLSASRCHSLKRLPTCIGKLCSLLELSLHHTALERLPDSIGSLKNLERLGLMGCASLAAVPDSVGELESLMQLLLDGSRIQELPASIGSLSYLRDLSVGNCKLLVKLPESIETLASISKLHLDGTPITSLPDSIGAMKMLRKLDMKKCQLLRFLPATIGNCSALTELDMYNSNITELPDSIVRLENLVRLRLDMCKQLKRLPDSLGKLKSLRQLLMKETAITQLPDSFGMLTSLEMLDMERRPYLNMAGNNMPTGANAIVPSEHEEPNSTTILSSFSCLTLLVELNAHGWRISGEVPDDFEKLSSLENLNLGHNSIHSLPASMKGLSCLKKLLLAHCRELRFLPPLPSSLTEVDVANCTALQYISDISNLDSLEELKLINCEKVADIPGLEHLKSLRRLYMNGCNGCSSAVKKRFSKVLMKKLEILVMPGSKIPDWFSGEAVRFSKRRNRQLMGIICGGVLSFDHIPENQRDSLQLWDVIAKIFNLTDCVYQTTFRLLEIPRTNEEHVFLRRFGDHPLVLQVKDGYALQVAKRNPPCVEQLELKKCGIHLVFEGDDDYDGDEGSLDESQHSVSHRLAKFFNSM